jgi:hypothetical protein
MNFLLNNFFRGHLGLREEDWPLFGGNIWSKNAIIY